MGSSLSFYPLEFYLNAIFHLLLLNITTVYLLISTVDSNNKGGCKKLEPKTRSFIYHIATPDIICVFDIFQWSVKYAACICKCSAPTVACICWSSSRRTQ